MKCDFDAVHERDMDIMFSECLVSDIGFLRIFLDKIGEFGNDTTVCSVALSETELDLGESDITLVVEDSRGKHGILIEDKVDAIDMDEQHGRYLKRGEVAVNRGDYLDFFVFIVCPDKYYETNDEAKKYEYHVSYEEALEYYRGKENALSDYRAQQIEQAIERSRRPTKTVLNEKANAFFVKYSDYQQQNYPDLDLRTKRSSNGYWAYYATLYGRVGINHKIGEGQIDLNFPCGTEKMETLISVNQWLRDRGINTEPVRTGKTISLRTRVRGMDMNDEFDSIDEEVIRESFDTIRELNEFARVLNNSRELALM